MIITNASVFNKHTSELLIVFLPYAKLETLLELEGLLEKRRYSRRCKIRPLSPWMRTKYAQIYHPRPQVSVAFSDDRDHARLTGTGASLLAGVWFARVQRGAKDSSNICVDGHGENGPYTHGHWTDSACCRRTPCLHRLRTASVRLRTVLGPLRQRKISVVEDCFDNGRCRSGPNTD